LKNNANQFEFLFYFIYLYFLAGMTTAMQWHLKKKHKLKVETIPKSSDPERFKCTYCQKVFRQSRGLEDHLNTHTGM